MKVKIQNSCVSNYKGNTYSFIINEEVDIPKELADNLIKAGHAKKKPTNKKKEE